MRDYDEHGWLRVVAARDVAAGEEITLNYLGAFGEKSSREDRQAKLRSAFFFDCTCNRCEEDKACCEYWDALPDFLAAAAAAVEGKTK